MKIGSYQRKYIKWYTSGFTLVELLVVISIIALLLAILIPSLQRARGQARGVVCRSNMHQMVMSFLMYAQSNNNKLPNFADWDNYRDPGTWWYCTILPYLNAKKDTNFVKKFGRNYMRCPETIMFEPQTDEFMPASPDYSKIYFTYGVTYPEIFGWVSTTKTGIYYNGSKNTTQIKSSILIAADCKNGYCWQGLIGSPANNNWIFNKDTDGDGILDSSKNELLKGSGLGQYNGFSPRHANKANGCFIDGSVHPIPLMDWLKNKNDIWAQ